MSNLNPPRRLLFGPGPTQVHPRVYEAMGKPIVGHLDPFFFEVYEDIRRDLRAVFGTQNPYVQVISGTGSAGMETALANFVERGQKLAVFTAGYFAERLVEMGRRHGATVVCSSKPWGETFTEEEATAFVDREKPHAVAFVHAETSTGARQDLQAITGPAHAAGAITITDCVTSLGAMPINIDASGVDVAFSCTQKGLSCPPGLSPITVSPAAVERLRDRKTPCPIWYMDLKLLLDYYEGAHRYHHTAPISNFYALREGLALAREEGIETRFARHQALHDEFVRRIEAVGLEMFIPEEARRITNINTLRVPEGVDDLAVRKRLLQKYDIDIAGGFGPLAGKIFRIGLMGPLATPENVDLLTGALIECLHQ
jgi:alanine-glyoxylate transaminase/serine-glyoxylate transaminase/serine-pyruvate transaminase